MHYTLSGSCGASTGSLWLGSFPPSSPRPAAHRQLCSRTSQVLRTHPTSQGRASLSCPHMGSKRGPGACQASLGISRLPRKVLRCMRGVSDSARPVRISRLRHTRCCLPPVGTTSAPGTIKITELNTLPAPAPVNASTTPLRTPRHDSGTAWLARPSLLELSSITPHRLCRRTPTLFNGRSQQIKIRRRSVSSAAYSSRRCDARRHDANAVGGSGVSHYDNVR